MTLKGTKVTQGGGSAFLSTLNVELWLINQNTPKKMYKLIYMCMLKRIFSYGE